jgi:hypothetical protein
MKKSIQLIDPRIDVERGVDHSIEGKILVQKGKLKLVWRGGSTYWSGMQGNRYSPSSLSVTGIANDRVGRILLEGGRLSSHTIMVCAEKIDSIFGKGVAKEIDINWTLILDNTPKSSEDIKSFITQAAKG